jgi:hypothetical protein
MAGELDVVIDPLIVVQQARLLAGDGDGARG